MSFYIRITHEFNRKRNTPQLTIADYDRVQPSQILLQVDMCGSNIKIEGFGPYAITGSQTDIQDESVSFGFSEPQSKIQSIYTLNTFAGGRFVVYEDGMKELTIYGSGVYIAASLLSMSHNMD